MVTEPHDPGCKTRMKLLPNTVGKATFAEDNDAHRLTLERHDFLTSAPAKLGYVLWHGMNPSAAAADQDDLTVRKEWVWTRRWGYGHYVKTNTATYRWTQSRTLGDQSRDLIHPHNLPVIRDLAKHAALIVLSCGKPPRELETATQNLFAMLRHDKRRVLCLGMTRDGWPKHSSRIGYDTPLVEFKL